ncbi:TadE/TadG family type IV pilus assembly protein [Ruegeria lacuscaerulensis]|uniref:TadE/TadG family type IV pilus assembly protein n=1 Tax=Ruegeria lacuscaerulensis TaxID=55218 RepID=UPI00147DF8EA|nr:TadE/TadG family type IV pilus assembly protein [Ruegeria lacuscaerulensis]
MIEHARHGGKTFFGRQIPLARHFAQREDGAFTIFVLLGFLVILATTGMGVDLMNFERDRANLQSTLDRAVLAAADLDQQLPPKAVVVSYLEKAGLGDKLVGEPVVEEGLGSRRVSARAQTVVPTHFMRFSGVKQLTAVAASTAEESIGAVEISLVLDMSGSMNEDSAEPNKTKIEVLRDAAKEFVTLMLQKQEGSEISMSIIPYATQVNAGADILDKFTNVSSEHSFSHCVNFTSTQFQQAALDPATALERTGHFDVFTNSENPISAPVCPVRAGSEITPVTDDITVLHNRIDALTATGNTSIDVGMKWGTALLDPAFQDVVSDLSTDGNVPAKFSNRPLGYEEDVLKIVIVMTDGQNTSQFRLRSDLRSGNSNVWYNPNYVHFNGQRGEYSTRVSSNPPTYFWTRQGVFRDHPFGDNEPGRATRLTYPQLFNQASLYWNAVNNYRWQNNHRTNWYNNAFRSTGASSKNTRTTNICAAAKNKGTIIYGIAFEAPAAGLTTIKNCASSDSHVYEVDEFDDPEGISLEEAFASIASSIKKLRLTQ